LRREIEQRLKFLVDVGLDYLTIGRAANTLSGGESQRIRLASQLGTGLSGVLYVLDEPTIGLHPRDNGRLIQAMQRLRDLGNTVLVVEHDRDVIASSDAIRDFGPGAGPHGGTVVAEGTPAEIMLCETSVTGPYLTGAKSIDLPRGRKVVPYDADGSLELGSKPPRKWLQIRGANYNTLKLVDVDLPLGALTAITGPSGSGKSSLIQGVLYTELARLLSRGRGRPGSFKSMEGIRNISKVLQVDQSPLGSSPSSTPATYVQVFDHIRTFFSALPAAKYIYRDSFSFNSGEGRCATCEGLGKIKIEMHFLPDVWIECEACNGKRYRPEVLGVTYKGYSIHDVLEMSSAEALELFNDKPKIAKMLDVMCRVGLDYVKLGQSSATLSGGESQRVKLAAELCRPSSDGKTMFLLDEPTTGLHFDDIRKLMFVLDELVDRGNTVIIIEHNIEVIRSADWVIDMGPEAGVAGGEVVFAGTPEGLVSYAQTAIASGKKRSYTGEALAEWEKKRLQLTRGNLLRTN
jgi:excinuclease ABC subunit A